MKTSERLRVCAAVAAVVATTAASAQERPYSPAMSCRALKRLVETEGAVVIGTSRTAYDRYVHSQRFCYYSQETVAAWVPAGDDPECFVGYTCREHDRERSR